FGLGTVTATVARFFGSTVSVTGVAGMTTLTGCFCGAFGSFVYWNCVWDLSTRLYVPRKTTAFASTTNVASFFSAAMVTGWLLLMVRLGGRSMPKTCIGLFKSGQMRVSFTVIVALSPC